MRLIRLSVIVLSQELGTQYFWHYVQTIRRVSRLINY